VDNTRLLEITSAAERLFSHRGYHATTMRQVAGAVELQAGSLYAHISGKEAVLEAIVLRAADEFEAAIRRVPADGAPETRLRAAMRAHIGVIAANLPAAKVYFHDWHHLPAPRLAEVLARRDAYEAVWRGIVADGVASGAFAAVDVRLTARLCLSACNWIPQWYDPAGALDPDSLADAFCAVLLGGLASRPPAAGATSAHAPPPTAPPSLDPRSDTR